MPDRTYQRILITGAAGRIGSVLRQAWRDLPETRRLSDVAELGAAGPGEEIAPADLRDFDAMQRVMEGVDAVVHLGASAEGRDWPTVRDLNLDGMRNTAEAARRAGVKRFVFASSNHAMGMYGADEAISPYQPQRPDSYYGISKAFGEDMLRYYHDKYGMEAVCLRIGSFQPEPQDARQLSTWLSHRDAVHLVERALRAPGVGFLVVFGFSANARFPGVDANAARIGYKPQDNAEEYTERLRAAGHDVDGPRPWRMLGGPFTAPDFDV